MAKKSDTGTVVTVPVVVGDKVDQTDRLPTVTVANSCIRGCSFELATVEGKKLAINAMQPPTWQPVDGGTYTIRATDWIVYDDETEDEQTGEVKPCVRACFVSRDGVVARVNNEWSVRRLLAMTTLYTREQWQRGIDIECYVGTSRRRGQPYGSFRVLGLAPDEPQGETK